MTSTFGHFLWVAYFFSPHLGLQNKVATSTRTNHNPHLNWQFGQRVTFVCSRARSMPPLFCFPPVTLRRFITTTANKLRFALRMYVLCSGGNSHVHALLILLADWVRRLVVFLCPNIVCDSVSYYIARTISYERIDILLTYEQTWTHANTSDPPHSILQHGWTISRCKERKVSSCEREDRNMGPGRVRGCDARLLPR